MDYHNLYDKKEVINGITEIAEEIDNAMNEENVNKDKVTKLMFEQLLRGLYLQNVPMN